MSVKIDLENIKEKSINYLYDLCSMLIEDDKITYEKYVNIYKPMINKIIEELSKI